MHHHGVSIAELPGQACCPSPDNYELPLPEWGEACEWNCPSCGDQFEVADSGLWD